MNFYILVEGEKTEMLLYPKWISYILPNYQKVDFEKDVISNNYYLFTGGGIPHICKHTVNAIKNINDNPVFDILIVCLDGEEIGIEARKKEIKNYIEKSGVKLTNKCKIEFVIQNVCIETWFLGNRKIVKKQPQGTLLKTYLSHHDVVKEDPELMDKLPKFITKAQFHYHYFTEILKEHNITYRKHNPSVVLEKTYFDELEKRISETQHLSSLKQFIHLLYEIKNY